ncbi:MAG: PAS domain S-box protein [Ignavibacteriales bacterium]|nr:PAS domain S-box protein [Ignavibacteriales bacterium]
MSESNFRQLFENNITIMLIVDPETANIIDANQAALAYYGYSKSEILALKLYDINTEGPAIKEPLNRAKNSEQIFVEYKHRLKKRHRKGCGNFAHSYHAGDKTKTCYYPRCNG